MPSTDCKPTFILLSYMPFLPYSFLLPFALFITKTIAVCDTKLRKRHLSLHPNTRLLGSSLPALKQVNCPAHATTVYLFTWPHSDSDGNIFLFPYVWKSTEHWYRVCTHSGLTYQQYLSSPTNNVGFAFFTDLTTSELPTDSKSKIYTREDWQFTIQRFIALGSKTYCLPFACTLKLSNSVGVNFLRRA